MRKIFLALFTCMLLFVGNKSQAQLTVTMSTVTVDSSQNASVDVTVAGFTNLLGVTFSVNWDSLVLEYVNTTNFSTAPVPLSINNIGPPGQGIIKKGQMTFSWDDQSLTPRTLPNGTRLFTIVLKAIGNKCAMSDVVTSSTPIKINITYDTFIEDQNLVNVKGVVTIDCDGEDPDPCPNPACSNPSNLTFSAPTITAQPGDEICIPISVKNFNNINSGQGAFTWNPALLRYTGATVPANGLPEMGNTLNENDSLSGKLTFVWVPDNTLPKTLPDGTVIIELCFTVLGAPDSKACLLMGQGTPETIWSTEQISSVPTCYNYGMICVTDEVVDIPTLRINTGNGSGKVGDTVCINVTVDSLINGLSFKTEFNWNQSQLRYIRTDGYNLQGLTMSNFNNGTPGKLTVAWNNPNPVNLPNGTTVFQICFELLQCPVNAAITISGVTEGSALINGNPTQIDVVATGGAINITCVNDPPVCTLGTITNVSCNGGNNGSILLSVTGSTANCTCLWKNSSGTIVKPAGPVASGCNLTGVAAGTYTYEVSCGGTISCSGTATITQPTAISISGQVTNVGCGQNGSILLTTTGGTPGTGNPPYTYAWTPTLGNTANPTNLQPGSYTVTVTDVNQCTATPTSPFVVGDTQGDLVVTATSTNIKCKDAGDGKITVTVSGGCPTYTYVWSNPQLEGANPTNVKPGTYTVTVTDGSNPVESKTATVTITEPASNPSIAVTNITGTPVGSSVGTITLTITGGTAPYGTSWSGPTTIAPGNTSSVITASNLAAGFYNVTVTDANGCTAIIGSPIEVPTMTDPPKAPVATASITTIINGVNVPCFGNNSAVIRVSISAGTFPITVKLFKGAQEIRSQAVNTPTFDFTGLDAGSYRVEYSNTAGSGTPIDLVVTQPSRLAATQKVECTEKNGATGTIEISLNNTGTFPYTFNWFGLNESDNKVEDLPADAYNVTVTDNNGCTLVLTNIEVRDCSIEGPCYEASTIISPNGDNINDVFLINCVTDEPSDLTVFDRWGRVVYSQSNYDNTWQGIDNAGKDLIESSYIWVLTVNFGQGRKEVQKGTVTVLRTR